MVKRPEIKAAVQQVLDTVNGQQPPYNTLKKFAIMDHDFTQETCELTPTLKVKRKACTVKYQAILDGLYDGKAVSDHDLAIRRRASAARWKARGLRALARVLEPAPDCSVAVQRGDGCRHAVRRRLPLR